MSYNQRYVENLRAKQYAAEQEANVLRTFATDHEVSKAVERAQQAAEYRRAQHSRVDAEHELQIVREHQEDAARRARQEAQARREQEEAEQRLAEDRRVVADLANKDRIISKSEEIQTLRRAIEAAIQSKANALWIEDHKRAAHDERIAQMQRERDAAEQELARMQEEQRAQAERDRLARAQHEEDAREHVRLRDQRLAEERAREMQVESELVRQAVDSAVAERDRQLAAHRQKTAQSFQEQQEFLRQRDALRAQAQQAEADEERVRQRYQQEQDAREQARRARMQRATVERESLLRSLAAELARKDRSRQRLEELRQALAAAYEEQKTLQLKQEEDEKRRRTREELLRASELARHHRAQQEAERRAEEDAHKRATMDAYRDSVEVEQANDRRRRELMNRFRADLEAQIDAERRARVQAEADRRVEERRILGENSLGDDAREVIRQERERLVRNYAAEVLEYMPGGVLQDSDIDYLPEEVRANVLALRRSREFADLGADVTNAQVAQELSGLEVPTRRPIEETKRQQAELRKRYDTALPW